MSGEESGPVELFSIVMPAYNEEGVIEETLRGLTSHLDAEGFRYEIVVVNDGSRDGTAAILERLVAELPSVRTILNPGPGGYGYAIRKGLEVYRGDAMVIVTADGSDSPKDVAAYFRKIEEGYDCAFGSRFVPGTVVTGYPPFKLFVNRISNRILSWIVGHRYNDFTNGFKCYRRHVVDYMQPLVSGQFNITVEMSIKATQGGFRYAVVPNDWTQRDAGDSKFDLFGQMKLYLLTLLFCSIRHALVNTARK